MNLNCIIVDDEPLALNLLEDYVNHTPFLNLTAKCSSGIEVIEAFHTHSIDVIFMDIQMPEINGIELSKLINNCSIVFTTAFEKYAIEGFKVNAIDYLLKPFSYAEFLTAAEKAKRISETIAAASNSPTNEQKSIVVKSDYRQRVIDTDSILYIEGIRDYIKISLDDESFVQTLMSLKSIEEMLPSSTFVRVHRSFIVNIDKVKTIERSNIVFGKLYIPISDSYKETFNKMLSKKAINW